MTHVVLFMHKVFHTQLFQREHCLYALACRHKQRDIMEDLYHKSILSYITSAPKSIDRPLEKLDSFSTTLIGHCGYAVAIDVTSLLSAKRDFTISKFKNCFE